MHDNIVQFAPAARAERAAASSIEAASEVSASAVVQFSPRSKTPPSRSTDFPKMASLTSVVSTDISLNECLRKERSRRWHAASAKAEILRGQMDLHTHMLIGANYGLPEVLGYPPVDPTEYHRLLEKHQMARSDMLLTPAPDMKSLLWKCKYFKRWGAPIGSAPGQIKKVIAADEAFLNAHPTRHCRHRPAKEE